LHNTEYRLHTEKKNIDYTNGHGWRLVFIKSTLNIFFISNFMNCIFFTELTKSINKKIINFEDQTSF
jgi:hypothetical protein